LDALLDNALVWVNHDGSVQTKADYLAKIRTGGPNPIQIAPESMTVRALGNTATVVGIYREKVIAGGQAYSLRYRFINTWAFQHGKWVCIAAAAAASAK
jgi:ketosteroid isomerase-like protein